jgi:hypothetical protein
LANIPTYHSGVKKAVFWVIVVNPSFIHSKAVACAIYKYLTGNLLPRERCKGKDDVLVMAEVALATQDPDIIHDLRVLNGRPKSKLFDVFWSEIKTLLESHARVDDRRHGKRRGLQLLLMLHRLANDICFDVYAMLAFFRWLCLFETYRSKLRTNSISGIPKGLKQLVFAFHVILG